MASVEHDIAELKELKPDQLDRVAQVLTSLPPSEVICGQSGNAVPLCRIGRRRSRQERLARRPAYLGDWAGRRGFREAATDSV
jgi:hypothetical protein